MATFRNSLLGNSRRIVSNELSELRLLAVERRRASLRLSRWVPEDGPEIFSPALNAANPLPAERN